MDTTEQIPTVTESENKADQRFDVLISYHPYYDDSDEDEEIFSKTSDEEETDTPASALKKHMEEKHHLSVFSSDSEAYDYDEKNVINAMESATLFLIMIDSAGQAQSEMMKREISLILEKAKNDPFSRIAVIYSGEAFRTAALPYELRKISAIDSESSSYLSEIDGLANEFLRPVRLMRFDLIHPESESEMGKLLEQTILISAKDGIEHDDYDKVKKQLTDYINVNDPIHRPSYDVYETLFLAENHIRKLSDITSIANKDTFASMIIHCDKEKRDKLINDLRDFTKKNLSDIELLRFYLSIEQNRYYINIMISRAFSDKCYESADLLCDCLLFMNRNDDRAYFWKLLAENKINSIFDLWIPLSGTDKESALNDSENFRNAVNSYNNSHPGEGDNPYLEFYNTMQNEMLPALKNTEFRESYYEVYPQSIVLDDHVSLSKADVEEHMRRKKEDSKPDSANIMITIILAIWGILTLASIGFTVWQAIFSEDSGNMNLLAFYWSVISSFAFIYFDYERRDEENEKLNIIWGSIHICIILALAVLITVFRRSLTNMLGIWIPIGASIIIGPLMSKNEPEMTTIDSGGCVAVGGIFVGIILLILYIIGSFWYAPILELFFA